MILIFTNSVTRLVCLTKFICDLNIITMRVMNLYCTDITNAESFEKVNFWVTELLNVQSDCIIVIVGTKCMIYMVSVYVCVYERAV